MSLLCCTSPVKDSNPSLIDELNREKQRAKEMRKKSKQIDRALKKSGKEFRETIKLLLLGTGESGKSTVLKQMRIIHTMTKFSLEERKENVRYIKSNMRDSILSILDAMERFGINFENNHLNELKEYVYDHIDAILLGDPGMEN